jgi:hypothetical protein
MAKWSKDVDIVGEVNDIETSDDNDYYISELDEFF